MKSNRDYKIFSTKKSCIKQLEAIKWKDGIVCPYCFEERFSNEKSQERHHCNACNRSFSVTINTIFHDSKLPLQKWFWGISLLLSDEDISVKELQRQLKVTYKTAWYMNMRIRRAMIDQKDFLMNIVGLLDKK